MDTKALQQIIRSTLPWAIVGLAGWNIPRYLIANETTIASKTPPYQVTAAGDVILDFTLNEKVVDPPTISAELLKYTSVHIPLLFVLGYAYLTSKRAKGNVILEVRTAFNSFAMAIGLCEGTTQFLKLCIQRRRPSFYDLCGFDIKTLKCTASLDYIREANFSFPSGHSSLACGAATFVTWFILGKLRGRQRWMAPFVPIVCWGWAILVAASRLIDKWHHPADVVTGLGLGFATCTIAYHTWYPPIWSASAGVPRSQLDELDTSSKLPSFNE